MPKDLQKGYGILEIVLVVSIGLVIFLGVQGYLSLSLKIAIQDASENEALYLAKSSLEEARALRDGGWANVSALTLGNQYNFQATGADPQAIAAVAGTKTIGKYTAWIRTYSVARDINDDIVSSGGTVDANTLKIVSSVSWQNLGTAKQVDLYEYLVNLE